MATLYTTDDPAHAAAIDYAPGVRYPLGRPIRFHGYAEDLARSLTSMRFSLDEGATWTPYPLTGCTTERGLTWTFTFAPPQAGIYHLMVRAAHDEESPLIEHFAFQVTDTNPAPSVNPDPTSSPVPGHMPGPASAQAVVSTPGSAAIQAPFGSAMIRAVGGGPIQGARFLRGRNLSGIDPTEAHALIGVLGVNDIYDLRSSSEVAANGEPLLFGAHIVSIAPDPSARRKDASRRLIAGVIGKYGAPGERMERNYRAYAHDNGLIGFALRSAATCPGPALLHCENGKDRTGVASALIMRLQGFSPDQVMEDYLISNDLNADANQREFDTLSPGMTDTEKAMLWSFLQVRPAYLDAFWDELDRTWGGFDPYVRDCLRLDPSQLRELGYA